MGLPPLNTLSHASAPGKKSTLPSMFRLCPVQVLLDLNIHNFNIDFLGDRETAGNRRGLGQNSSAIPCRS
jgi:hypothetical protein